jgi:hypothetical protein
MLYVHIRQAHTNSDMGMIQTELTYENNSTKNVLILPFHLGQFRPSDQFPSGFFY